MPQTGEPKDGMFVRDIAAAQHTSAPESKQNGIGYQGTEGEDLGLDFDIERTSVEKAKIAALVSTDEKPENDLIGFIRDGPVRQLVDKILAGSASTDSTDVDSSSPRGETSHCPIDKE
mmetsp:Transcript_40754/g.100270  ORF Transcript_40754/g.100270 Transcript_40754/m.100270 type:complete len:118 (-) Transcript_40754:2955-3308(-)